MQRPVYRVDQRVKLNEQGAAHLRHKFQYLFPLPAPGMKGEVVGLVDESSPRVRFTDFKPCILHESGGYWMAYNEVN